MSSTAEGMLPGDEFSLQEWSAAQGKPNSAGRMTVAIEEAFLKVVALCKAEGIPVACVFAHADGLLSRGDLQDKPENVPSEMLLARAITSGQPQHMMAVASAQMGGLQKL